MKFILGKKLKMSQIWKNDKVIPVTMIKAGPITVTQIKTKEKDGYEAAQIGFDLSKKKINKPLTGHLKNLGNFKCLKEFRIKNSELKIGDILDINQFQEGEKVKVSGLSKGRGFQGVVKRHGFFGGPQTHGQKNRLRAPGSIGSTAPQRVMPGRKMAGRMGSERVTVKNLEIATIDREKNILMLRGAVPGTKETILEIRKI
ncbi:MAG: 50S ribosomal protein L3 [Candidatus Wolfebacteria bacterium GW2011_GWA1_44_24]|uniref:Large ribosomal subunit protein uL3 n=2 Tax=Candidatus Wolfeibacteriota TaxID=1752735 RepID=A0A0G0UMV5_9BACT|nr:MAG: 50S ribosomal protein L3 [Candidatus Wolfebacteria bacterium GW2011_GWB1_41_12]KKT56498.1 MAG: 50S ribosomal protein L3 [Candidatus Wolfebacteria bacterium GW2011_GWA1_44_24]